MEIDRLLLSAACYCTTAMPVSLTAWLCEKMYTSVEHDFCTTCYERPPVLSDRFCWAEGVVAQDRFYCSTMWIHCLNKFIQSRSAVDTFNNVCSHCTKSAIAVKWRDDLASVLAHVTKRLVTQQSLRYSTVSPMRR